MNKNIMLNIEKYDCFKNLLNEDNELFSYAKQMINFFKYCRVYVTKNHSKYFEDIDSPEDYTNVLVNVSKPSIIFKIGYIQLINIKEGTDCLNTFELEVSCEEAKKIAETLKKNINNLINYKPIWINIVDINNCDYQMMFRIIKNI